MKNAIQTFVAICMALMLFPIQVWAQQALGEGPKIVSPDIHDNHTVTFRLRAPKAVKVQVVGDCIPTGMADLVENKEGVWEYTTAEPLKPELYTYAFQVDGLRMNDPSNVFMIRDVSTVTNVFIVGGERADLYKVSIRRNRWYGWRQPRPFHRRAFPFPGDESRDPGGRELSGS